MFLHIVRVSWKAQYSWNYSTESNLPKYISEKQVFQKAFPSSADLVERAFPLRLSTQSFFPSAASSA